MGLVDTVARSKRIVMSLGLGESRHVVVWGDNIGCWLAVDGGDIGSATLTLGAGGVSGARGTLGGLGTLGAGAAMGVGLVGAGPG